MKLCLKQLLLYKGVWCGHRCCFGLYHILRRDSKAVKFQSLPQPTHQKHSVVIRFVLLVNSTGHGLLNFTGQKQMLHSAATQRLLPLQPAYFIGSLICPPQRKPNAINSVLNDSQFINSHQVSSFSTSLCPGTYIHVAAK